MGDVQGNESSIMSQPPRSKVFSTSQKGIDHIKESEGFRSKGYYATPDEKRRGIVTVGYGSTGRVKFGEEITPEQGEQFLREDVKNAEDSVRSSVNVPLNQNQFDAATSLVFNVGEGAFEGSNALKALNAGNMDEFIFEAFDKNKGFVRQSGKIMEGLQNRRARERELFEEKE